MGIRQSDGTVKRGLLSTQTEHVKCSKSKKVFAKRILVPVREPCLISRSSVCVGCWMLNDVVETTRKFGLRPSLWEVDQTSAYTFYNGCNIEDCDIKHRLSQAQVDSYIPSQISNKSIENLLKKGWKCGQTSEATLFSEFYWHLQLFLATRKHNSEN